MACSSVFSGLLGSIMLLTISFLCGSVARNGVGGLRAHSGIPLRHWISWLRLRYSSERLYNFPSGSPHTARRPQTLFLFYRRDGPINRARYFFHFLYGGDAR